MEAEDLRGQVDILEYISQYCDLEEKNGEYWCLSPFKDEQTPSFSVDPEQQIFYDFSSGAGGDVIEFVKRYHQCGFHRALEILAEYAGVDENAAGTEVRKLEATKIAKLYSSRPKASKRSSRTTLPSDHMLIYEEGGSHLDVWRAEGISDETMRFFQVRYDSLSNRIVFPIRDPSGEIINVCGRTLDPNFKTKKLRKYTYFYQFGALDTIYGLSENREEILRQKEIILFEGAKSVMLARDYGYRNTGAILTSHLNEHQFKLLIKLGVRVVFALDAEVDIRQDKQIQRLLPYVTVEWLRNRHGLLADKDAPVDRGKEIFETLYQERRRLR